jgi:thiosulfate/3-mercaptopyruvate sulfurtransferase
MTHVDPLVRLEEVGLESLLRPSSGPIRWLDCRFDLKDAQAGEGRYLEGHIPGAVYAHLDKQLSGLKSSSAGRHPLPSVDQMKDRFEDMGVSSDTHVIAYDDSDMAFASRAWWMLKFLGHEKVSVLDGGWASYLKAGGPVEKGRVLAEKGHLSVRLQRNLLVEVPEVASLSCLVDARDPARYRGEVEPIDPVAGHIPGALNFFYRQNMSEDLKFKSPDVLHSMLERFYASGEAPAFYCGSGVTACVNVLACEVAGLPLPRLYAGSWSEWIRDSQRPVAKGV